MACWTGWITVASSLTCLMVAALPSWRGRNCSPLSGVHFSYRRWSVTQSTECAWLLAASLTHVPWNTRLTAPSRAISWNEWCAHTVLYALPWEVGMCKSHRPNDLAPGIVVIQNEFLSPLLPCASAGVTACYKAVENCSSTRELVRGWTGRMRGRTLLCPLHPWSRCARAGMQGVGLISVPPLCLWATRPYLCLFLTGQLCSTQFPLGLIGKMSDMLKVALGFMQSQWCLSQLVDFRFFSKFHWTVVSFGKCLRSGVKFWWRSRRRGVVDGSCGASHIVAPLGSWLSSFLLWGRKRKIMRKVLFSLWWGININIETFRDFL